MNLHYDSESSNIIKKIDEIGAGKGTNDHKSDLISQLIYRRFRQIFQFVHADGIPYMLHKENHRLCIVIKGSDDMLAILATYNVYESTKWYPKIMDKLTVKIRLKGEEVKIHHFSTFNAKIYTVYVSDFDAGIHKITPDSITHVPNGTDGVLFLPNPTITPIEKPDIAPEPDISPFEQHITHEIARCLMDGEVVTPGDSLMLIESWIYSLFFPELLPTRPILCLVGEAGSGKTSILRRILRAIFGDLQEVSSLTDDPRDFDAVVSNRHLVCYDNVDSRVKWLEDRLAQVSTGSSVERRQLYSDNTVSISRPRAYIALTARTPKFRRDDVSDRLLVINTQRIPDDQFIPEFHIQKTIHDNRWAINHDLHKRIQRICKAMKAFPEYETCNFRMQDFASFCLKVARSNALGNDRAMKLHIDATLEAFDHTNFGQAEFAIDGNEAAEIIAEFLGDLGTNTALLTVGELREKCAEIADQKHINFDYYRNNGKAFGIAFRHHQNKICKVTGGTIEKTDDRRDKRVVWALSGEGEVN